MPTATAAPDIDLALMVCSQLANRLGITAKQACAGLMRNASDECNWESLATYAMTYTHLTAEES